MGVLITRYKFNCLTHLLTTAIAFHLIISDTLIKSCSGELVVRLRSGANCPSSGYFRDEVDCRKFHRCAELSSDNAEEKIITRSEFDCPPGTIFDELISNCNHVMFVRNIPPDCNVVESAIPDTTDTTINYDDNGNDIIETTETPIVSSSSSSTGPTPTTTPVPVPVMNPSDSIPNPQQPRPLNNFQHFQFQSPLLNQLQKVPLAMPSLPSGIQRPPQQPLAHKPQNSMLPFPGFNFHFQNFPSLGGGNHFQPFASMPSLNNNPNQLKPLMQSKPGIPGLSPFQFQNNPSSAIMQMQQLPKLPAFGNHPRGQLTFLIPPKNQVVPQKLEEATLSSSTTITTTTPGSSSVDSSTIAASQPSSQPMQPVSGTNETSQIPSQPPAVSTSNPPVMGNGQNLSATPQAVAGWINPPAFPQTDSSSNWIVPDNSATFYKAQFLNITVQ